MSEDVALSVNGQLYAGWKSVSIVRSLEQLAGTFRVAYVKRATADGRPVPINEGDTVTLKINDKALMVGYVDDSDQGYDAGTQRAQITGRSKTGDAIDCAAVHKSGAWKDSTILQIATDLLKPFGISATAPVGTEKIRRFSLQEGETTYEAIERAARMRALVATTTGEGDLHLTRAGSRQTATVLERGVNVKEAGLRGSWKERFSTYTIKTQAAQQDDYYGQSANQLKRTSTDDRVSRYRPTIIMAENEDSGAELQARADWERNVRAGRARRYTCKLQGWRDDAGALWEPNTLVKVKDSYFALEDELIIATVTLDRTLEGGTTTTLELTHPSAFTVEPLPPKRQKSGTAAYYDNPSFTQGLGEMAGTVREKFFGKHAKK